MELPEALNILALIHTGDAPEIGFIVHAGAHWHWTSPWSEAQYIEAWKVVREHVHMPVEPGQYPAPDRQER